MLDWIMNHYKDIGLALAGLVSVAEIVVRMTPTEKDDGAVERIGGVIKKGLDLLKIPNVKK